MASTTDYEEYAKDSPREHDASELSSDLAPKGGEGGGVLSGGPPQQQQQPPSEFPEGGTRAWLTVAGGWACLFVSFGWVNCVGIFQDYYESHQLAEYSSSEIAWIPALQGTHAIAMLCLGTHKNIYSALERESQKKDRRPFAFVHTSGVGNEEMIFFFEPLSNIRMN